jgi:hypothetical protein
MELDVILDLIVKQFPAISGILIVLGSLVVLGQIVVNEAYDKVMGIPIVGLLLKALTKFSIIQKK